MSSSNINIEGIQPGENSVFIGNSAQGTSKVPSSQAEPVEYEHWAYRAELDDGGVIVWSDGEYLKGSLDVRSQLTKLWAQIHNGFIMIPAGALQEDELGQDEIELPILLNTHYVVDFSAHILPEETNEDR